MVVLQLESLFFPNMTQNHAVYTKQQNKDAQNIIHPGDKIITLRNVTGSTGDLTDYHTEIIYYIYHMHVDILHLVDYKSDPQLISY